MNWKLLFLCIPDGAWQRRVWMLIYAVIVLSLLVFLWNASESSFGKASGLADARHRIESLAKAGYWMSRATLGGESDRELYSSHRGYIDRAQGDLMLVYLYAGSGRERVIARLANVKVASVNIEDFASQWKGKNLKFDMYMMPEEKYRRAVVWHGDIPLNLSVIEKTGGAELNPPTNVVDKIFARYYWRMAVNGR